MNKRYALLFFLSAFAYAQQPSTPLYSPPAKAQTLSLSWGTRWKHLPPTPKLPSDVKTHYAEVNGIRLFYGTVGKGSPVVLLHGGLSNANYWASQIEALQSNHSVIVVDSRGHGRSSLGTQGTSYHQMSDDVIALLDKLHIPKADIVGWSDGGIIGIDLAIRYPERIGKVFSFAPNTTTAGVNPNVLENPTFAAFVKRSEQEYIQLSPTPKAYPELMKAITTMWETQPNWKDEDLKKIKAEVVVVLGDHDEAIVRSHAEYIAATIPEAGLLILPNLSHFAHLQDPKAFNLALCYFLDGK